MKTTPSKTGITLAGTLALIVLLFTLSGCNSFPQSAKYRVVAAGRFDTLGQPVGATYNQLQATQLLPGEFLLHYPGYIQPSPTSPVLIIKGLPIHPGSPFSVVQIGPTGIRVKMDQNVAGFMVEISSYKQ